MNKGYLSLDSTPNHTPGCPEEEPEPVDEAAEAAYYLKTLKAYRRIAPEGEPLGPDQTHRIEMDEKGRPVLRRKRFSAV